MNTSLKHFCLISLFLVFTVDVFGFEYFFKIKKSFQVSKVFEKIREEINPLEKKIELTYSRAFKILQDPELVDIYVLNSSIALNQVVLKRIAELPGVDYIELVPVYEFSFTPNDFNSNTLWHLNKISAAAAWDLEKGGKNIVIGLIDDGLDTLHSEIQPVLWHNTKEIKGNGIDDDKNGYVDDFFGWDAADNDNNPCVTVNDNLSHGTHCAGIAGAATHNSNGIASIGFNVKIMAVKVGQKGKKYLVNPYLGVEYAIVNGANVLSMSWGAGPQSYSSTYQILFDVAFKRKIVCVAAAQNNYDTIMGYPAGYNHVISVGSTDNADKKSPFSCYGSWVDIMAPGSNIYSTLPGNTYGYLSGTSMACPMVSGLCALMLSRNSSMTPTQVENCLKSTADNIDAQNSSIKGLIGAGRINAYKALICVKGIFAEFSSSKKFVCVGDTVTFYDASLPFSTSRLWSFPGGTPSASVNKNPIVRYNTAGVYKVELIAVKGSEQDTIIKTAYITVGKPKVTFSGFQSIEKGEFGTIKADFTGNPPWKLVYSDGKKLDTITNILKTPFFILKKPDSTTTYKPIEMVSNGCQGDVFDSTRIVVTNYGTALCDSAYRFHLSFGGNGDDQAYDICVGGDSFMYIAGKTNSNGAGNYDAFVAKISNSGKIYWYRTLGGSNEDGFLTIAIDKKENVYCGGYSHSNVSYRAAMMVKYDKNGNLKWRKYYNGIEREYLYDVLISKDNKNIYFTGHSISDSYGGEDYCIYKVDTSGVFQWVKRYGSSATERPVYLEEDDSLNVYAFGSCFPGSYQQGCIVKVNSAGTMLFSKSYNTSVSNDNLLYTGADIWNKKYIYAVGTVIQSSSSTRRLFVSKLNLNGTIVWSREVIYGIMSSVPKIKIIDNKLVIINYTSVSSRNYGILLTLDSNANVLTTKSIGSNSMNTAISQFDLNGDKSISYVGFQSSTNNQFVVGKTNCKYENVCLFNTIVPSTSSQNLSQSNYFLSSKNFTSVVTPSHSNNSYNFSTVFNCQSKVAPVEKRCRLNADFSIVRACTGSEITLSDKSIDSSNFNKDNFFWEFGDGGKASGVSSVKHKYINNGTYQIKLVVISSSDGLTCSDTAIKNYISSDSLYIELPVHDTSICIGDSMSIGIPKIDCGIGPYKYFWTPSIGLNDSSIVQPYFSPKKSTKYQLTIRDINGNKYTDTIFIAVNKSCCISKARIKMEKEEVCIGDSVQFVNESSYSQGSEFFRWTFVGANISSFIGKHPPKVVFTPGIPNKVSLQLSDICSNDSDMMNVYLRRLPEVDAGKDTVLCKNDTIPIGFIGLGRDEYFWTPTIGLSDSRSSNPMAMITQKMTYVLQVVNENGCIGRDTIHIDLELDDMHIHNDTAFCNGDSMVLKMPDFGKYLWSNGKTTQQIVVNQSGSYWGQRTLHCIFKDTVNVQLDINPKFTLGKDSFICAGDSVVLRPSISGSKYLWNTGDSINRIEIKSGGQYWLRITENSCSYADTITFNEFPKPIFTLGLDSFFCKGDSLEIKPSRSGAAYLWSTGKTSQNLFAKTGGNYWLRITQNSCSYFDTITISEIPNPIFSLGADKKICNDSIKINPNVFHPNVLYTWSNGKNSSSIYVSNAGQYTLLVKDAKGCIHRDTVNLTNGIKPQLEIPDTIYKCISVNYLLVLPQVTGQTYSWYDHSSSLQKVFPQPGKYWVKAKTECKDSIVNFEIKDSSCICNYFIPNAISLNGDGINESFGVVAKCNLIEFNLIIFNRWGEILFKSNDMHVKWDGTYKGEKVPVGVYFYTLEFRKDLQSIKEYIQTKGSINVIR